MVGGCWYGERMWGGVRGDNLGLSARQNFQPWNCWAFPRGYPPLARRPHLDRPPPSGL